MAAVTDTFEREPGWRTVDLNAARRPILSLFYACVAGLSASLTTAEVKPWL